MSMKKIIMILLIILMMCFVPKVYAADGVAIESVDVDSKSADAVIVSPATFDGLSVKFDIKFDNINDFVKYKLVIKNSTDTDYELTESTSSSSYITYEYGYEDGSKVLTANSSKTMYITVKYSTSVPIAQFTSGNYTETKSFTINLDDGTDEITVPSTSDGLYCYLVLLIGTLVFSIALLKLTKNKKFLVLIIASMVLIPIDIHAIVQLKLIVESKVEINNPNEITPTICWALQEQEVDNSGGSRKALAPITYKLVISNKEQEDGAYKGCFAGTTEFSIEDDGPWITDNCYIENVVEGEVEGRVVPKSTAYWFAYAGYAVSDISFNLANLNTINVTNMRAMFSGAGFNSTSFDLDLSGLDVSNVTDMSLMFWGAGFNSTSFDLDLSGWDTSSVTNMTYMFKEFGNNAENFALNLSEWDTSNVTNMSDMFSLTGEHSLTFNLNISGWNTSNVTNMNTMFDYTGIDSTEKHIILPETNGNGIANTDTIIYGIDTSVYADINHCTAIT